MIANLAALGPLRFVAPGAWSEYSLRQAWLRMSPIRVNAVEIAPDARPGVYYFKPDARGVGMVCEADDPERVGTFEVTDGAAKVPT